MSGQPDVRVAELSDLLRRTPSRAGGLQNPKQRAEDDPVVAPKANKV